MVAIDKLNLNTEHIVKQQAVSSPFDVFVMWLTGWMMDRFTLILNGFVFGFLFNSVVMRITGAIDKGDIAYPVILLILSGILLAARLTTRDT